MTTLTLKKVADNITTFNAGSKRGHERGCFSPRKDSDGRPQIGYKVRFNFNFATFNFWQLHL